MDTFAADLARLAELTPEELTALESNIMSAFDAADEAADTDTMEQLADALDQVRAELSKRGGDDDADEEIAASAAAPEAEDVTPAEENPTDDNQPEALNAGAESKETPMAQNRAPKVEEASGTTAIIASVDVPGYTAGTEFQNMQELSKAMANRANTLNQSRGGDGEKVMVASLRPTVDPDRMLLPNDPEGNRDKIRAITDLSALIASGGCCAPLTTRYDLFSIGETSRPVRDALAGFNADRGGIRYFTGPTLSSLGTNTGIWTCDDDEAYSGTDEGTWKVCGTVDCPPEQTAITQAITSCLTFGVLSSRVFPENVEVNTRLSLVQHARVAESALLSNIKAGSTQVTGPAVQYGAVRDLLLSVGRVAAWYRDRHRLDREVPLRAILPMWVLEVLRSDIIVQPPAGDGRTADFAISANDVENFFDQWGINITWSLDGVSPTVNGGGNYGALPADGTLPLYPTSVEWALYAEGSWLFLDGGALDLGIVRDAKLVRSNDYMQFSETFEGVAKLGGETLWVTSPVEIRGGYSMAVDLTPVTTP